MKKGREMGITPRVPARPVAVAILIGLSGLLGQREASALSITEIKVVSTPHPDTAFVAYLQPDDPKGNIYTVGDTIRFEVKFDHTVRVTGRVTIGIYVGDQWRAATYRRRSEQGSGTFYSTEFFEYRVQPEDRDEDGVRVVRGYVDDEGRQHGLGGNGTITHSSSGDTLEATYSGLPDQSGHRVDGSLGAWITNMEITSTPANGRTYRYGEDVEIEVTFSHPVRIGTEEIPWLPVQVDEVRSDGQTLSMQRTAKYQSGSGTRTLRFAMTVASYYKDDDGFEIWKKTRGDTTGTLATDRVIWAKDHDVRVWLRHDDLGPDSDHKLNGKPYIKAVAITSSPKQDKAYRRTEVIQVTVTFDQKVEVEGSVSMKWKFASPNRTQMFPVVSYASGSGTESLVFEHTVTNRDGDLDGLSVQASGNGGWVGDGAIWSVAPSAFLPNNRVQAGRNHNGISDDSDHKVKGWLDPIVPTISSIEIVTEPDTLATYAAGEWIGVKVTFDEDVVVTGTPQLELTVGTQAKTAEFGQGSYEGNVSPDDRSTGPDLLFGYQVQEGDMDRDGIAIWENKLSLNGGAIDDTTDAGNAADLTHERLRGDAAHKVDAVAPAVASVAITSRAGGDSTYAVGDSIRVTVTFSKNITVSGEPQLELIVGSQARAAAYDSTEGAAAVFAYVVQEVDNDEDGISIAADKLTLNGGAVEDGLGNAANLDHEAVADDASHTVLGTPVVTSVAITSRAGGDATYAIGDRIKVTVTFSEDITVTGSPQLELTVGSEARTAAYDSSEGAAAVFSYVVQEGDDDEDGIAIADTLRLNGGTIEDGAGNAANLAHGAVAADPAHRVDGVLPTLTGVWTQAEGTHVYLSYSEEVTYPGILDRISRFVNVDPSQFFAAVLSVEVDGDLVKPRSTVAIHGGWKVRLPDPVTRGQEVTVAYDNIFARDAPGLFIDRAGNPLANFGSTQGTNRSSVADAEESGGGELTLSRTELRVDEGASDTYTVALASQPSDTVGVALESSSSKLSASPDSLTFTADNWSTAQTVTLTASEDDDELNYWVGVTHKGRGGGYDGAREYVLVVIDDDDGE